MTERLYTRNLLLVASVLGLASVVVAGEKGTFTRDVIELVGGHEVAGKSDLATEFDGFCYEFATAENLARFTAAPAHYAVQLDGACARMGPLGTFGNPDIWVVRDGKLYIFRSQDCRETFLRAPERFVPAPGQFPEVTADATRAGRVLLDKAISAAGGADRLAGISAWKVVVRDAVDFGGQSHPRTRTWLYAPEERYRYDGFMDEREEHIVLNGGHSAIRGHYARPLYSAAQQELRRTMRHQLLSTLKAATRPDFRVALIGDVDVSGAPVKLVQVAFADVIQTLAIDADPGHVLSLSYRERGMDYEFAPLVETFSDFRTVDGLTLPFRRDVTSDGHPWREESYSVTELILNPTLDRDTFELPPEPSK